MNRRWVGLFSVGALGFTLLATPLAAAPAGASDSGPAVVGHSSARIVGGGVTNRAKTPWFINLDVLWRDGSHHLCGGSAIGRNWILTAAHCLYNSRDYGMWRSRGARTQRHGRDLVLVGKSGSRAYVNPRSLSSLGRGIYWSRVVLAPGYVDGKVPVRADLALIQTKTPLMGAKTIPYSSFTAGPAAGTFYATYGFGLTVAGGTQPSQVLKTATIFDRSGTSPDGCGYLSEHYVNGEHPYLPRETICAGQLAEGTDSCQGDSGGPLTTLGGRPVQVGVVAWGLGCGGGKDWPGLYTRISTYSTWIKAVSKIKSGARPTLIR